MVTLRLVQEHGDGAGIRRHLGDDELAPGPHPALPEEVEELAVRLGLFRDALHHQRLSLGGLGEGMGLCASGWGMPGIGLPWGQVEGMPSISASRSSTTGESACSSRCASS